MNTGSRRQAVIAAFIALLSLAVAAQLAAARPQREIVRAQVPGPRVEVRARHVEPRHAQVANSSGYPQSGPVAQLGPVTADIQVTYSGFSPQAQAAFQAAVDIWETRIVSSQVIHVAASWTPLGSGILGSAGPTNIYKFNNETLWYPVALFEARCSCETSSTNEITASFNSAFSSWYLGTDGNPGANQYDFETVVLHELGHGLGFLGSFNVSGGKGSWGYSSNGTKYAMSFDTFEYTAATGGNQLINTSLYPNPSVALKTELTDGSVYFGGPNAVAAKGGRAKLYAPSTWSSGSSNAHFDEATFTTAPDSLMTPFLANGEVIHQVGAVTIGVMRDIGWATSAGPPPTASPSPPPTLPPTASPTSAPTAPPTLPPTASPTSAPTTPPTAAPTPIPPIVDLSLPALTNSATVPVTLTESDPAGTGIAGWFLSTSSTTPSLGDPGWLPLKPTTYSVPAGDGSKTIYAWVKNNVGTVSAQDSATTVLDTTAPIVFLPIPHIGTNQKLGTTALIHIAWPAAFDTNGISSYALQVKRGTQAWLTVSLGSAAATSVDTTLVVGAKYRFRLAATDAAGNVSGEVTTAASTLKLVQEKSTAIVYSGSWKRVALSGASGGYVKRSLIGGNTGTYSFSGQEIAFVSTLGPARGIVQLRVDGTAVATIDLYAATLQSARVVWSGSVAPGSHTLEVRVTGTRNASSTSNRVDIDAFLRWT